MLELQSSLVRLALLLEFVLRYEARSLFVKLLSSTIQHAPKNFVPQKG